MHMYKTEVNNIMEEARGDFYLSSEGALNRHVLDGLCTRLTDAAAVRNDQQVRDYCHVRDDQHVGDSKPVRDDPHEMMINM